MIISTRNWLADLGPATIDIPTTADGYSSSNLWSGGTANAWRSANADASHYLWFRLTASRPVDFAAIFDVRAPGGASVVSVELVRKPTWDVLALVTTAGALALNARGDGSLRLPMPIGVEAWGLKITLSVPALLYVGGAWIGQASATAKAPTRLTRSRSGNTILNVTEAKTQSTARLASPTQGFSAEWSVLTDDESADLAALFDALSGAGTSCVAVPLDDDPAGVFFGRFGDSLQFGTDPARYWSGHSVTFSEDGRAIGG